MFEKTQQCSWCFAALSSKAILLQEFPSSKPPMWECSVWIPIKQRMIFLSFGSEVYSVPLFTLGVTCLWEHLGQFSQFLGLHICHFCLVLWGWTHWPVSPTFNRGDKVSRVNVPQVSCKSLPGCEEWCQWDATYLVGRIRFAQRMPWALTWTFYPIACHCVCALTSQREQGNGSGGTNVGSGVKRALLSSGGFGTKGSWPVPLWGIPAPHRLGGLWKRQRKGGELLSDPFKS